MKKIIYSGAYLPLAIIALIVIKDWTLCESSISCLLSRWWVTWLYVVFLFYIYLRLYNNTSKEYDKMERTLNNLETNTREVASF